jgi:hypothetical protein
MIDDPNHPVSAVGLGGYEFEDDPSWSGARDVPNPTPGRSGGPSG